jgi:hypothetical protein
MFQHGSYVATTTSPIKLSEGRDSVEALECRTEKQIWKYRGSVGRKHCVVLKIQEDSSKGIKGEMRHLQ